jgi:hypothetical protein
MNSSDDILQSDWDKGWSACWSALPLSGELRLYNGDAWLVAVGAGGYIQHLRVKVPRSITVKEAKRLFATKMAELLRKWLADAEEAGK